MPAALQQFMPSSLRRFLCGLGLIVTVVALVAVSCIWCPIAPDPWALQCSSNAKRGSAAIFRCRPRRVDCFCYSERLGLGFIAKDAYERWI